MGNLRSVSEQMETIVCPAPSRTRSDDRVVEVFLHCYREGRFSVSPEWLPQDRRNVEVIASDGGRTLAIEHTRVCAFEDHQRKEVAFRQVAEHIELQHGLLPHDRWYSVTFQPDLLDGLNHKKREAYEKELASWLIVTLPGLAISDEHYEIVAPVPSGKPGVAAVQVLVWQAPPLTPGITVGGCLPNDPDRLDPVIRKALHDKVPKLADANANERLLLLEMPMISDSHEAAMGIVCRIAREVPEFDAVDHVVVAKTAGFKDGVVFFFVWSHATREWGYLKAKILK